MTSPRDVYTHGHHPSVLRSHDARTAENSAAYLLPFLRRGTRILDVGCGPGSITRDFADIVAPAVVVGIENVPDPLELARANATAAGDRNVRFELGDVYAIDYPDDSFDVVHAHQVLQHLTDPVAALREMRRVCASGGIVAARDADYAAMTWYPATDGLDRWLDLYRTVAYANGAEPDAGRRLLSWARQAGFERVTASASVWCYADAQSRTAWGTTWAERVTHSSLAIQAVERELASIEELAALASAWTEWAEQRDGWFTVLHGEIVGHVG
jgi:ubiquinone/menaquinone biosynthesis C-methylase UbiE